MKGRRLILIFAVALSAGSANVFAAEGGDIGELKAALAASPGDRDLKLRLGMAYFEAGNDFWAVRTLSELIEATPDDCEARAWLGLAYLRRAFPDQALSTVDFEGCSDSGLTRLKMVKALALKASGRFEAADRMVHEASVARFGFRSDVEGLPALRRRVNPASTPEVSWSLEVGGGYTSNAAMGAATDQAASGSDEQSGLMTVDARVRLAPDFGGPVRGIIEVQPRLQWFFSDGPSKLSFFELTGQAGIQIRSTLPRVVLAYRPDWLLLPNGFRSEMGPVPYMIGHRGEFEIEVMPEVLLFGGAGTRKFREMARSRTEVDLGIGGGASPVGALSLLWAASGRYYDARHRAWDLAGFSATFAALGRLPYDMNARVSVTVLMDFFFDSAARDGEDPFYSAVNRTDFFYRLGAQFWSPSLSGVRFGVSYDFSSRDSTSAAYSFQDHRILARVRWTGTADMHRPAVQDGSGDVGLIDWGDGVSSGVDERVQDMLRQDEQVQRSSSCVN